jgi:hypothetical protein
MTAAIEIEFQSATFTADNAAITVGNGSFELSDSQMLSMYGAFPFDTLNLGTGSIGFYNSSAGASVSGVISIPVAAGNSGDPTITVTAFSGAVTLSWPSNTGPQYQALSPGDPITLTGFGTFGGMPD